MPELMALLGSEVFARPAESRPRPVLRSRLPPRPIIGALFGSAVVARLGVSLLIAFCAKEALETSASVAASKIVLEIVI